MDELIDKVILKRTLEFNGSINELKEKIRIKKEKKLNFEWILDNEFKFLAKISIGTILINFNPGVFDGIKGYGKLIELNNGKTKIELITKVRIELYFFAILSLFVPFLYVFSDETLPVWILFL